MSWKMSLEDLVAGTEGRVLSQMARDYAGVGTDTRTSLTGKVFIALKGENFDAHDMLESAVDAGAAALVVNRLPKEARLLLEKVTIVEVDDTLIALQKLGNFWRHKNKARIIGITGSSGKTTTKEFAAAIIGSRFKVHFSKGSLNNHWGVPLSLLAIEPEHEVAIIEMGMNHLGELTTLSQIAEPDIVCVTMVGRGHLLGLGSVDGVAHAKAEIYQAANAHAVFVFNLENPHTRKMYDRFAIHLSPSQYLNFAGSEFARRQGWLDQKVPVELAVDVSMEVAAMDMQSMRVVGEIRGIQGEATVQVFGAQNVTNIMAAACLALAAGMTPQEIWAAVPRCQTVWGRNQWVNLASGARVLFDGYNANPESMAAALDNFKQLKAANKKYAILGEMKEMGESANDVHRELGEKAAQAGFDAIAFFGPTRASFGAGLKAGGYSKTLFESDTYEQSLAPAMLPVLQDGDIVLIKGSRGMQLEKALLDLKPLDFQLKK